MMDDAGKDTRGRRLDGTPIIYDSEYKSEMTESKCKSKKDEDERKRKTKYFTSLDPKMVIAAKLKTLEAKNKRIHGIHD